MKPTLKHPKPKKRPTKSIVRELDVVVSQIVRRRDKKCVICGSTQNPQAGHFIGRRHFAVRWDLTNVHQQCSGCNIGHNSNPIPYTLFIQQKYGEKYPETLDALSREPSLKRNERLDLLAEMKLILDDLPAGGYDE